MLFQDKVFLVLFIGCFLYLIAPIKHPCDYHSFSAWWSDRANWLSTSQKRFLAKFTRIMVGKTPTKNCINCDLLGFEDDNSPICLLTYCNSSITEKDDNTYKLGFPFKNKQPCHVPAFWIYVEADPQLANMLAKEMDQTQHEKNGPRYTCTFDEFIKKYRSSIPVIQNTDTNILPERNS